MSISGSAVVDDGATGATGADGISPVFAGLSASNVGPVGPPTATLGGTAEAPTIAFGLQQGAPGATGAAGSGILNTGGTPYNYSSNTSWSLASKTTIASFTFTPTTARARITFSGSVSGGNNAYADFICEINGVAGTEKASSVHYHTNGPRGAFQTEFTHGGLTIGNLYTCTLSITPGSGTTTCNAISTPITNWLQAVAREGS